MDGDEVSCQRKQSRNRSQNAGREQQPRASQRAEWARYNTVFREWSGGKLAGGDAIIDPLNPFGESALVINQFALESQRHAQKIDLERVEVAFFIDRRSIGIKQGRTFVGLVDVPLENMLPDSPVDRLAPFGFGQNLVDPGDQAEFAELERSRSSGSCEASRRAASIHDLAVCLTSSRDRDSCQPSRSWSSSTRRKIGITRSANSSVIVHGSSLESGQRSVGSSQSCFDGRRQVSLTTNTATWRL